MVSNMERGTAIHKAIAQALRDCGGGARKHAGAPGAARLQAIKQASDKKRQAIQERYDANLRGVQHYVPTTGRRYPRTFQGKREVLRRRFQMSSPENKAAFRAWQKTLETERVVRISASNIRQQTQFLFGATGEAWRPFG